ncbi:MAG: deoxyguanosinetriphosphate triphosphohydrolase [PVC group bacterium]|nr:deoxyguanosinetriphosphate triphosphohydrolase [PVC group bacterium]
MTNNPTITSQLAPYAMNGSDSKGRQHKEPEHAYRGVFQRDRDRIIHSRSFRRLQYKTQVFVNNEGDQYRTRLTHTLEVVQIARTIAKALNLNESLVEAIALAHDIGHTPFGHAGEDALHEIMKDHGGFEHNQQGLRVVDILEERYPDFIGLNLTWEVREGIIKHDTTFDSPTVPKEFDPQTLPTLEAQVVDIADEIAYNTHDLDDGISSGLIKESDLNDIAIWNTAKNIVNKNTTIENKHIETYQIIRTLINLHVTELVSKSKEMIQELGINSQEKVRQQKEKIITFQHSPMHENLKELSKFLYENLYRHYKVIRMSSKAQRFMKEMFNVYLEDPKQLPHGTEEQLSNTPIHRVICDYIAGMTDRYALDEYKKLFHPWEKV